MKSNMVHLKGGQVNGLYKYNTKEKVPELIFIFPGTAKDPIGDEVNGLYNTKEKVPELQS